MNKGYLFIAAVLLSGVSGLSLAATYQYSAPTQNIQAPVKVGSIQKTTSGANVPAGVRIAADNFMGDLEEGTSTVKVFSFVHDATSLVSNIAATLTYSGVNSVKTSLSCTPPATLTSAAPNEVCDLFITYYGDSPTLDREYFTINLKGFVSSSEYVDNTFTFSANVGTVSEPPVQGTASLAIQKTGADINLSALDIGSFDKYIGSIPSRTVTVSNSGDGDASGVSVSLDSGSSKFSLSNNTCGAVIPAGQTCSFNISFNGSTTDSVDSYFSSVGIGYNNGTTTTTETSAIVGYVLDTTPTPPAGALEFVSDANNPTPNNIVMEWTSAGGTVKRITVKNSTSQAISGIYPSLAVTSAFSQYDLQLDPNRQGTCGFDSYEDYQYNEQANDWLPVQIPASPVTLAAGQSCYFDVIYSPIFKQEQLPNNPPYFNGVITVNASTTPLTANISASVSSVPGKLVIMPDAYSGTYDAATNSYNLDIRHMDNTGSRDSYFVEPLQITVRNVGNTPVTSVISNIAGVTSPVFVYGLYNSPYYGNSMLSSEFLISPVDFWTTCGKPATSTAWTDIATYTLEPSTAVTLAPYESCQIGVVYNPATIYNGYSPSAVLQVTGSNGSSASVNIKTNISGVIQSTALSADQPIIPGWKDAGASSNIVGFMYVPVSLDGNEFFQPTSSTVTNTSGSSTAVKALQYLRGAYTSDLGVGNLESSVCGSLNDFRTVNFGVNGQYANWPDVNVNSIRWTRGCYVPVEVTLNNASSAFQYTVTVSGVTSSGAPVSVTKSISGNGNQLPSY